MHGFKKSDYLRRFEDRIKLKDGIYLNKQIYIPEWGIEGDTDKFFIKLDSFVFFWNDYQRKEKMKASDKEYVCFRFITEQLLGKYSSKVNLCEYNSGSFFQMHEHTLRTLDEKTIREQSPKMYAKMTYKKKADMFIAYNDGNFSLSKKSSKIREILIEGEVDFSNMDVQVV